MRKRFSLQRVCSSERYSESRKAHISALERNHVENKEYFDSIPRYWEWEYITMPMEYTEENIRKILCLDIGDL